jgi:prepilin-type N-terminal cleavage/methylation domain-containing protein
MIHKGKWDKVKGERETQKAFRVIFLPSTFLPDHRGFTLIETLVAISLLMTAIVAPMALAAQSLASAYYARDQITAYFLAQEAVEAVRSARDANILHDALSSDSPRDLLSGIPVGQNFTIDATADPINAMKPCYGACAPLQANGEFYGYGDGGSGWKTTPFTRTVFAKFVAGTTDEVEITSTVSWQTGRYNVRTFSITENLYRWIEDGSAAH